MGPGVQQQSPDDSIVWEFALEGPERKDRFRDPAAPQLKLRGERKTRKESGGVLAGHLRQSMQDYNSGRGHTYELSMAVGACYFDPENPVTMEELMTEAQRLLMEDKRKTRPTPQKTS